MVRKFGKFFRDFGYVLNLCRFSALMLVAGFLMMLVDQGRDVLIGIAEKDLIWGVLFVIPVSVWAFNTWYWARVMLDFSFPNAPRPSNLQKWLRRHLPRALGALTFVAVGYAFINASGDAGGASADLVILACFFFVYAVAFYLLVFYRRALIGRWRQALGRGKSNFSRKLALLLRLPRKSDLPYKSRADLLPVTTIVLSFWFGVGVIFFLFATIFPVKAGAWAHDPAVVFFFWAGTFIPLGTLAVYASHRSGFPVLLSLFLLAVLFSTFNDNHALRCADGSTKLHCGEGSNTKFVNRPTVAAAVRAWYGSKKIQDWPAAHNGKSVPFVIVATAGGGSRAAYWTATVLGKIQDAHPEFRDHLFAISGVSGGSLGATVFRAIVARDDLTQKPRLCDIEEEPPKSVAFYLVAACGQEILRRDFLSPTVAAFLFPDLVQRFLPLPQSVSLPDRAAALEKAWERAWDKTMKAGQVRLSQPFLDLWPSQKFDGQGSWPALFLNGTWVQNGRRIVTSNLNIVRREPKYGYRRESKRSARAKQKHKCRGVEVPFGKDTVKCVENGAFVLAHDLLYTIGRDVPASTAANNSARFPFLGPGGTLRRADSDRLVGRVVDGGYFENFGAVTAREILREARAALGKDAGNVRFIVIQISSDPDIPQGDDPSGGVGKPMHFGYEMRSPVRTFLRTRSARGFGALKELEDEVINGNGNNQKGQFFHFRMCKEKGVDDPPLGWTLSTSAQGRIRKYLDSKDQSCSGNKEHLKALREEIFK